ncbi:MAG TPA: 2-isopropylmalate synthase [Candidatus Altiarchaeales archaeon]|nr:2-isopropylmalate synthase [Candidatus Altiarchaeales archaeon]
MKKTFKVLDTTLRDGEQTPGVTFTLEQKLNLAKALDDLGVDVIEAGSAITSEGERQAIKAVANEGLNAEVSSFARILKKDLDYALECDVDSVFLVAPTSELHIEHKLKSTKEKVLESITECVQYCRDHGILVDVCCEDGSRSDPKFLQKVLETSVKAGADRFTVADTVGVFVPEETAKIFKSLKSKLPLGVHCHDDFGLGTANTVAAVHAGAEYVDVTVNGLGERAGNTSLEEVAVVLTQKYGYKTGLRLEKLVEVSDLVEKYSNIIVPPNKAVVGDNAFTHEAGIHVDGILKNPETYEPLNPELVGGKRRFMLGKHVGLKSVKKLLDEDGFKMSEDEVMEVFNQVKFMGDKGKRVTSSDLNAIANNVLGLKKKQAIKMEELVAVAGNKFTPTASVKLIFRDQEVVTSGTGTGPVDAAINALRTAAKDVPFELMEYHVDAISGGTDALVQILVKLKSKGKIVTAQGAGSDIILASVDAMVNGLNAIIDTNGE